MPGGAGSPACSPAAVAWGGAGVVPPAWASVKPWAGLPGGQPDRPGWPAAAGGGLWCGGGDGHAGDRACWPRPRAAVADGAVQEGPQGGLAAGGGQPEQDGGGDAGAGGQVGVARQFGGDAVQVLAAGIVLQEKVRCDRPGGGVLGPLAVPVGAGQVTPQRGAPPFGPPARQRSVPRPATLRCQRAEHRVGPRRVSQLNLQRDGQGPVAAVAKLARSDPVFGGQQVGTGFVEDEMQRRGPQRGKGTEPVDGAEQRQTSTA